MIDEIIDEIIDYLNMIKDVKDGKNNFIMYKDIVIVKAEYFDELLKNKEKVRRLFHLNKHGQAIVLMSLARC